MSMHFEGSPKTMGNNYSRASSTSTCRVLAGVKFSLFLCWLLRDGRPPVYLVVELMAETSVACQNSPNPPSDL